VMHNAPPAPLADDADAPRLVPPGTSPLWLVTQEPSLDALVTYLDAMRQRISAVPAETHVLEFSRSNLDAVRHSFDRMIRRGEETLHQLCELLCSEFFDGKQLMHSVVVGEVESHDRFTLVQSLTRDDLRAHTDLDLGTRQLQRFRYTDGSEWKCASLIANFVEYQPLEANRFRIHKLISRIKAEEQIWNKVVDGLFGLERLVRLDKQLSHLSAYVKDVFAVKAVVTDASAARNVHEALLALAWSRSQLESRGIAVTPAHIQLQLVEVKDYLSRSAGRKRSGWGAIKSVIRWGGTMIEIQVQPMTNYHRERERLTRESHAGFKARREAVRNTIADSQPLFGFYRDLLRWLFLTPTLPPPRFPSVVIVVNE
jgi:hypothetical protein